jgi:hypothetical protein
VLRKQVRVGAPSTPLPYGEEKAGVGGRIVSTSCPQPVLTKNAEGMRQPSPVTCAALSYERGLEAKCSRLMRKRLCLILVETYTGRRSSGLFASDTAQPYEVALALRDKGWAPYRIRFDREASVWIAKVIDWGQAA